MLEMFWNWSGAFKSFLTKYFRNRPNIFTTHTFSLHWKSFCNLTWEISTQINVETSYFILLSWLIKRTQHYSVEYCTIFQLFQHMTDWTSDSTIQSVSYEQCPYSSVQRSCVILNIATTAAHVCKSPNFSSHYRLCPFTPRRTLFLNTNCQNIFLHKFNKILKQKFFNKIFVVSQPLWRFLPLFNL